jgi:hypothetical protein
MSNHFNTSFKITAHAVPEPSNFALFGLGLLSLAGIRFIRRRKNLG